MLEIDAHTSLRQRKKKQGLIVIHPASSLTSLLARVCHFQRSAYRLGASMYRLSLHMLIIWQDLHSILSHLPLDDQYY